MEVVKFFRKLKKYLSKVRSRQIINFKFKLTKY